MTLVIWVLTAIALACIASGRIWALYVAVVCIGVLLGAANNVTVSMVSTVFGRYDFARAFAVILPITVIFRSCGYGLVGLLASKTGSYAVPYIVMLVCCGIAFILTALIDDSMHGRN